ncbi:MAG: hypothetical protein LBQ18_05930 [Campylobacteraceae bacterium]|jgi:hypothetical protein|nr:hypothetical protein [Campylobacteraceae bacterium]
MTPEELEAQAKFEAEKKAALEAKGKENESLKEAITAKFKEIDEKLSEFEKVQAQKEIDALKSEPEEKGSNTKYIIGLMLLVTAGSAYFALKMPKTPINA